MNSKKKSIVPLLLTIVIGCFVLFLAWSGKMASTGGTDVTDRDYYSKGLKYNSTLVEKRAASVIGWQLQIRMNDRHLTFSLSDQSSRPVTAAKGLLVLPVPGGNLVQSFQLEEVSSGEYLVELPSDLRGERLARVSFELDGVSINRPLLLTISDPAGSKKNE